MGPDQHGSGRRAALLVAAHEYVDPKLARLRAPPHDVEALQRVLADPAIGGYDVRTLINEPHGHVLEEIEAFFADRGPDDLLLLYFSCHGVKDLTGRLYFAAATTKLSLLAATGLSSSWINEQLDRSRSRRVVVLLDCCYSGAFAKGLAPRSGPTIAATESLGGRGRAVIAASDAMEYAWEGDDLALDAGQPSVFTRALVTGLETGEADRDGDGAVAVEELYDHVFDQVRRATPHQTPTKSSYGEQGDLLVARNPNPPPPPIAPEPLPAELASAPYDRRAWHRRAAVTELRVLLEGERPGVTISAARALQQLADHDEDAAVKEAAAAALAAWSPGVTDHSPPDRVVERQFTQSGGPPTPERRGSGTERTVPATSPDDPRLDTAQETRPRQEGSRLQDISQLQEQLRAYAAAHDWRAVVATNDQLALLDPDAADPDGLATSARTQLLDQREAEERDRARARQHRWIAVGAAGLLAVAAIASAIGGGTDETVETDLEVPYLTAPPVIDGDPRDWPSADELHTTDHVVYPDRGSDPPVDSTWQLGWDEGALYLFVEVTDPRIQTDQAETPWELQRGDSIELHFGSDPTDLEPDDGLRADDIQFLLGPRDASRSVDAVSGIRRPQPRVENPCGMMFAPLEDPAATSGVEAFSALTHAGYDLEARVPWEVLGHDVTPGVVYALNLTVIDAGSEGMRQSRSTNPDREQAKHCPQRWGTVQFLPPPDGEAAPG
jgi:hypothetical protein